MKLNKLIRANCSISYALLTVLAFRAEVAISDFPQASIKDTLENWVERVQNQRLTTVQAAAEKRLKS